MLVENINHFEKRKYPSQEKSNQNTEKVCTI